MPQTAKDISEFGVIVLALLTKTLTYYTAMDELYVNSFGSKMVLASSYCRQCRASVPFEGLPSCSSHCSAHDPGMGLVNLSRDIPIVLAKQSEDDRTVDNQKVSPPSPESSEQV